MPEQVYVVTSTEMGWDCVCGVFVNYQDAIRSCYWDDDLSYEEMEDDVENGNTVYVIHTKKLTPEKGNTK